MGAIVLLIAAYIFIVDAAFLFGKADGKGTGVANVAIGVIMNVCGLQIGFTSGGATSPLILSGLTMAFSIFYIIMGWCLLSGYDLKALGWYCLGAGLWCLLAAIFFFTQGGDPIFGVFALAWATLFLSSWVNLITGNEIAGVIAKWVLAIGSIVTLLIPAYLLITGGWPPF